MEKAEPKIDLDDGLICEYCGKVFPYKSHLTIHRRIHTGEKPYTCDYCGGKFGYSNSLKYHMKNVCIKRKPQEGNKFGCEVCGKHFKHKISLKRHILCHTGEKPYTCDFCGANFNRKDNCLEHMRKKVCLKRYLQVLEDKVKDRRVDLANSELECRTVTVEHSQEAEKIQPTEDHSFLQRTAEPDPSQDQSSSYVPFSGHLERYNNINRQQEQKDSANSKFKCEKCCKTFKRKSHLIEHSRCHDGVRPFTCEHCGAKFSYKKGCLRHIRTKVCTKRDIQEGKKFGCEVCGKLFTQKSNLKRHILIHNDERPCTCDFCDANFKHMDNRLNQMSKKLCIKSHLQIDLDDELICEYCEKVFLYKSNLTIHRRSHTGEKPYTCVYCGSKFGHSHSLKYHMKKNVCIKQMNQISEEQVERGSLANPELEYRPMTAEEDSKEADNIQPTAPINPQYSQDLLLYQRTKQSGPSQDKLFSYLSSSGHPQDNSNKNLEQRQIAEQQVQDQPLDLSKPRLNPRSTVGSLETSSNGISLEGRPIRAKEHPQEADNIQLQ